MDSVPDAMIAVDLHGSIRLWNCGAERIFGFRAEEALGQQLELIIPERFRAAHAAGFQRAITTGQLRAEGKILTTRCEHKEGKRLYVDFSFSLLRDGGELVGVVAVGRDVTARQSKDGASVMPAQSARV